MVEVELSSAVAAQFGVRSRGTSAAARRIEQAGRAFQENKEVTAQPPALPESPSYERTSAGLRDLLFDAIEGVKKGKIGPQEAGAIGKLTQQLLNTVRVEIEVAKLKAKYPSDGVKPETLPLGETKLIK